MQVDLEALVFTRILYTTGKTRILIAPVLGRFDDFGVVLPSVRCLALARGLTACEAYAVIPCLRGSLCLGSLKRQRARASFMQLTVLFLPVWCICAAMRVLKHAIQRWDKASLCV